MKDKLLMLSIKLRTKFDSVVESLNDESGQDLVEYALVVALIAFGAITAMKALSTDINTAFTNIGNALTANAGL